ncbi:MAG: restriction endonuclease subunit S [Marinicella sp.]
MIAVTCSGTIGKVNIIPKHWANWTLNQHVMRIVPANLDVAYYIFCWLNTEFGKELITRHVYGSVVDEIDDRHLSKVEIPILRNVNKQKEINDLVLQANELRYQAYLKEQEAIDKMEAIINDTTN